MKVVIISHMHPREAMDGSILCAYLHAKYLQEMGVETLFFGGRKPDRHPVQLLEQVSTEGTLREYLVDVFSSEIFARTGLGSDILCSELQKAMVAFDPDIIHFHTILPYGFQILNKLGTSRSKKILTLHNYTPLCANDTCKIAETNALCDMSDVSQCSLCFPHVAESTFIAQRQMTLAYLNQMDILTTPGHFAKTCYVGAGIPSERIKVIPNGTDFPVGTVPLRIPDGVLRLGYIGRNSSIKGLNVLLAALQLLPQEIRNTKKIHLSILGPLNEDDTPTMYNVLTDEYLKQVFSLLRSLKDCITVYGKFSNRELPNLIKNVDCIVIPSVWWEVTPCVIQEAFASQRPVICSGIGGMAEMVKDGVDGFHFEMGNPHDLKNKLLMLLNDPTLLPQLQANIIPPQTTYQMSEKYLETYHELLSKGVE